MPLTNLRVQLKRATYIALGPLYSSWKPVTKVA
jgi:hypothetical protein